MNVLKRGLSGTLNFWASHPKALSVLILAAMGVAVGLGGYSLRYLNTTYSMRQFMPNSHPLYASDDEIHKSFNLADEQPILVTLQLGEGQTWLEPERMKLLRAATDVVGKMEGIKAATSLANVQAAGSSEKGISIGTLTELIAPETWKSRVDHDPVLSPGLISHDGRVAMIVGEIGVISTEQGKALLARMRDALKGVLDGKVQARVGGVTPIQLDMSQILTQELQRFLVLAFILCFFTLVAYFRSFSSVMICLILVLVANVGALAWMALSGVAFSVLSTSIPVLASIAALTIGTHTLLNFGNEYRADARKSAGGPPVFKVGRIVQTYRSLFLPNMMMALTAAVGFAALAHSNVPLIREYAWSVSGGIMLAWLNVMILLLPLMYFFPVPEVRKWTAAKARWALWVTKFRWLVFTGIGIFAILLAANGNKLNWSVRLFDDLPEERSLRANAELIDGSLGGMIPLDVMVTVPGETDAWNDPGRIAKLEELLAKWRQDPSVGNVLGLPDFVQMGQSLTSAKTRQAIAEIFFLYSMSENNPLGQFLTSDGQSTRVSIRLRDVPADKMRDLVQLVRNDLVTAFPGMTVKTGGMATMVHVLNEELSRQMITGLWESLGFISLLIIYVFRSLSWALIGAVPNLLAPLILLSTLSVFKTPIKPGVAIIFSIALGVAYNNTVYLMVRMKMREQKSPHRGSFAVDRAWYEEGNPCFFSTIALLGGFAIFLTSYFVLNRTFGAYMLLSIGAGLLGDLIFLPALLKILPWRLLAGRAAFGPKPEPSQERAVAPMAVREEKVSAVAA